jgi:hypothetical protein
MRRHVTSIPAKLLLALVLLVAGCLQEDVGASTVVPVVQTEVDGSGVLPGAWNVGPLAAGVLSDHG